MEFLTADFLGTPAWFWLAFAALVAALTAFDLGVLHKEDREMGIGESLKLTAFYIAVAMAFGAWIWLERGSTPGMQYFKYALAAVLVFIGSKIFVSAFLLGSGKFPPALSLGITAALIAGGVLFSLWKTRRGEDAAPQLPRDSIRP